MTDNQTNIQSASDSDQGKSSLKEWGYFGICYQNSTKTCKTRGNSLRVKENNGKSQDRLETSKNQSSWKVVYKLLLEFIKSNPEFNYFIEEVPILVCKKSLK